MMGRIVRFARERVAWLRQELVWKLEERRGGEHADEDFSARIARERDRSGSRFYSQPGFAVLRGEGATDPSGYDGDSGDAMARVRSALGDDPVADDELGDPVVSDASYGRGAAGWTAVVEWILEAAGQGIVGLVVTSPIVAAARKYLSYKRRMEERGADFLVNRAGALLIALDDVVGEAPQDSRVWLESAEEMSTAAGRPLSELNYVGADSWLVFLVDLRRDLRYVRIVSPRGEIVGRTTTSLTDLERLYLPAPE
jgi:hypothetical protein